VKVNYPSSFFFVLHGNTLLMHHMEQWTSWRWEQLVPKEMSTFCWKHANKHNKYIVNQKFNVVDVSFFFLQNNCEHRNVLSKRQVWMSIFHIINFKKIKIVDTGVLDFLIKNNPGLLFFLPGPVFLFQIFIIAPLPSQGIYNCIINNKLINNKFRFSI
jgi:hypothetical protein